MTNLEKSKNNQFFKLMKSKQLTTNLRDNIYFRVTKATKTLRKTSLKKGIKRLARTPFKLFEKYLNQSIFKTFINS